MHLRLRKDTGGLSTFFFGERESFLVFITGYKGTFVISFRVKWGDWGASGSAPTKTRTSFIEYASKNQTNTGTEAMWLHTLDASKICRGRKTPKLILQVHYHPDTKTRWRATKKAYTTGGNRGAGMETLFFTDSSYSSRQSGGGGRYDLPSSPAKPLISQ